MTVPRIVRLLTPSPGRPRAPPPRCVRPQRPTARRKRRSSQRSVLGFIQRCRDALQNCWVRAPKASRILSAMRPSTPRCSFSPSRTASLAMSLVLGPMACAGVSSEQHGAAGPSDAAPPEVSAVWPEKVYYRSVSVLGRRIFYRESGRPDRPVILLLHGFPASSHSYRELIPLLSGRYHVLAPDYLGSGFSERPSPNQITYRFDLLAEHVTGFVAALGIDRYVLYMQDFGSPVGFRVALAHPERLRGWWSRTRTPTWTGRARGGERISGASMRIARPKVWRCWKPS